MSAIKFISLLIIASVPYFSNAQSKEDVIKKIKHDFRVINANTSLKKITLDAEDFLDGAPDGGGELTGFYKRDTLVKIIEWIGISHGNSIREFYFRNNQLFFVYDVFKSFVQIPDGLDKTKIKTAFEGRYYIDKGVLIEKKLTGEKPLHDEPADILKELLSTSEEYRKKIGEKK